MSTAAPDPRKCPHCGTYHETTCHRIEALEAALRETRKQVEAARQEVLDVSTERGAALLGPELAGLHSTLFCLRRDIDNALFPPPVTP